MSRPFTAMDVALSPKMPTARALQGNNQPGTNDQQPVVDILIVSGRRDDHARLEDLFKGSAWRLHGRRDARAAVTLLGETRIDVVLCNEELPESDWRDVLAAASEHSEAPNFILFTASGNSSTWAEALNLGAYDLLAKPFEAVEVMHVVRAAWLSRRRRQNIKAEPTLAATG